MATKEEGLKILETILDDEPVLILRGKDPLAAMVVELYALQATISHVGADKVDSIRILAHEMRIWHSLYRSKVLSS